MPFLLLKLLGIGRWLKQAAIALLGAIGRYPWQSACIALLALSGGLWRGNVSKERLIVYMKAERVKILDAQDQARTAQIAVFKAAEDKSRQLAKDNSNVETQIRTIYVDRRDAYADRMRFDKVCRSSAGSPAQDSPPKIDHGPSADSIIVSRADFDILVENTGRLDAVHQWGEAQISAGLAVGE